MESSTKFKYTKKLLATNFRDGSNCLTFFPKDIFNNVPGVFT